MPKLIGRGRIMQNPDLKNPRAILFIQSDQHRADCLGYAGHPLVKTPNLDRLAREGMVCDHAFTPAPVCVPARSCLESGRWPCQHGVINNWDGPAARYLDPAQPTMARALSDVGWRCEYIGRWHVHPEIDPAGYGYHYFESDHGYGNWRNAAGLPHQAPVNASIGVEAFLGETDPDIRPEESQIAWLVDRTIERLRKLANSDQPFLLRLDTFAPHLPNRVPEPYASMYAPGEIEPWGSFREAFENKPYIQQQQLYTWGIEKMTWEQWAPVVGRYLGEITLLDHQIGRLLDELDQLGLRDETLVVYTSDHGDMCGGHRMIDKHFIMYEDVVRVPLVMRWPSAMQPLQSDSAFRVTSVDLPATLCELAGAEKPASFAGQSFAPRIHGQSQPGRATAYSVYDGNQFGLYTQRMVRSRRWKYVWNATDIDELYDLENDPHELANGIHNPALKTIVAEHRQHLAKWLHETEDPMYNAWITPTLKQGNIL